MKEAIRKRDNEAMVLFEEQIEDDDQRSLTTNTFQQAHVFQTYVGSFFMNERANREEMSQLFEFIKTHGQDETGLIEKQKIKPIIIALRQNLAPYNSELGITETDEFTEFFKPEPPFCASKEFFRTVQNHLKMMSDLYLRQAFNCLDQSENGLIERAAFR